MRQALLRPHGERRWRVILAAAQAFLHIPKTLANPETKLAEFGYRGHSIDSKPRLYAGSGIAEKALYVLRHTKIGVQLPAHPVRLIILRGDEAARTQAGKSHRGDCLQEVQGAEIKEFMPERKRIRRDLPPGLYSFNPYVCSNTCFQPLRKYAEPWHGSPIIKFSNIVCIAIDIVCFLITSWFFILIKYKNI